MDASLLKPVKPEPVVFEEEPKTPHSTNKQFLKKVLHYLLKIQKYSAYSFLGFAGLHLASVVVIPGLGISPEICHESFELTRTIYQTKWFENTMILGASAAHVLSGVGVRMIKNALGMYPKRPKHESPVIKNPTRDDIGLGGLTGILGLGYRRSMISNLTNLTPLTFSGYCLIPVLGFHFAKFRYVPEVVDGDSALVTLDYVNTVLTQSPVTMGNTINTIAIALLAYTAFYHFTNGMLKLRRLYSHRFKVLGYGIIFVGAALTSLSLGRFKRMSFDDAYLMKKYLTYVNYMRI